MKRFFSLKNNLASNTNSDGFILDEASTSILQKCLLDVYSDVLQICLKHGLKPVLVGGSLLGKIRHNGFIPWDNDFDMAFSREDYEKFKLLSEEFKPKYILAIPGNSDMTPCNFIKVYKSNSYMELIDTKPKDTNKVSIDVFPIDYVPNTFIHRTTIAMTSTLLQGIIASIRFRTSYNSTNKDIQIDLSDPRLRINVIVRRIIGALFSKNDENKMIKLLDKIIAYRKRMTRCTIAVGRGHYRGEMLPVDFFFPLIESDFCGVKTWLPNNSEGYLSNLYGDYNKIPPEEKREHDYFKKLIIDGKVIV